MQDNSIRQAVTGALSRLGGAQPVVPVVPNTNGFIGLPQQPSQQPSQPQVIEQHNCNPTGLQRMNKPVRTQGNRTPAVVDGKLRAFTVAAAGDAFAGFIAATTGGAAFNDEPNRYYLKRNGGKQSYIDKRYMYALGVELTVVAQPTAGNVDLAQASALQDALAAVTSWSAYRDGSTDAPFLVNVPTNSLLLNHHSRSGGVPLLFEEDQIIKVEQDDYHIQFDYHGVGRLNDQTAPVILCAQETKITVMIKVHGYFAETEAEALAYCRRGVYDPARRLFVMRHT
jgi:hypothetical protein